MLSLTSFLLSYVLIYKYLAIFIITFLGAIAFPLPSGTVVTASSAFAVQGYMSLPAVLIIAILGNVAGDNCGYWIARRYGIEALHKLRLSRFINAEKREMINKEIDSHPVIIIYLSRFMTGIAPTVNVVSGLTKLSYKKFLTFEFLGECTEVAFFVTLGYIFGANWEYITQFSGSLWIVILSGAVLTYLIWRIFFKLRKRIRRD
jgi:membrane protein DedA with SNARE-associated domain